MHRMTSSLYTSRGPTGRGAGFLELSDGSSNHRMIAIGCRTRQEIISVPAVLPEPTQRRCIDIRCDALSGPKLMTLVRTLLGAWLFISGAAFAEDYPVKPIKLIVPYPAG